MVVLVSDVILLLTLLEDFRVSLLWVLVGFQRKID